MKNKLVGAISLGCSKNAVDTELMLGCLRDAGFDITNDIRLADVVLVNTCGFITSAKEESINAILEAARDKREDALLAVAGCLTERYPDELRSELPEIDIFWGVGRHSEFVNEICARMGIDKPKAYCGRRILTTPAYSAYVRIADGCDNRCTYCAIPLIRGGKRSTPMERIVAEAETLAKNGARELTLIAQDTSAYGTDIYGKPMLAELLRRISPIDGIRWLRVLYAYPNTIDEELVDTMISLDNVVNYIDMPIQHIESGMLERMNRHGSAEHIRYISDYIRRASPDFILRTTVMTGFPGESDKAFDELMTFLCEHPFDRVGAFAYSAEDGTPAAQYPAQVDEAVAKARLDAIMKQQHGISLSLNRKRVGRTYDMLVERTEGAHAFGRSYAEAPDVDGMIEANGIDETVRAGDYIKVEITDAFAYDLKGKRIK